MAGSPRVNTDVFRAIGGGATPSRRSSGSRSIAPGSSATTWSARPAAFSTIPEIWSSRACQS